MRSMSRMLQWLRRRLCRHDWVVKRRIFGLEHQTITEVCTRCPSERIRKEKYRVT